MSWYCRKVKEVTGNSYWSVGYYKPVPGIAESGWQELDKFQKVEDAAWRVHFLNGGSLIRTTSQVAPAPPKTPAPR